MLDILCCRSSHNYTIPAKACLSQFTSAFTVYPLVTIVLSCIFAILFEWCQVVVSRRVWVRYPTMSHDTLFPWAIDALKSHPRGKKVKWKCILFLTCGIAWWGAFCFTVRILLWRYPCLRCYTGYNITDCQQTSVGSIPYNDTLSPWAIDALNQLRGKQKWK